MSKYVGHGKVLVERKKMWINFDGQKCSIFLTTPLRMLLFLLAKYFVAKLFLSFAMSKVTITT